MHLLEGEIPKGDIILKGLKLKNVKICSLFYQKTSKIVSQLHVFTLMLITKIVAWTMKRWFKDYQKLSIKRVDSLVFYLIDGSRNFYLSICLQNLGTRLHTCFPFVLFRFSFLFFFTVFHLCVKNNLLSALTSCLDINKFRIFLGSSWVLGSTKNAPKYMLYF